MLEVRAMLELATLDLEMKAMLELALAMLTIVGLAVGLAMPITVAQDCGQPHCCLHRPFCGAWQFPPMPAACAKLLCSSCPEVQESSEVVAVCLILRSSLLTLSKASLTHGQTTAQIPFSP